MLGKIYIYVLCLFIIYIYCVEYNIITYILNFNRRIVPIQCISKKKFKSNEFLKNDLWNEYI